MLFASNQEQLSSFLESYIQKALNYTLEKMHDELKRHILEDVYYFDYYPNKYYVDGSGEATMEFLNAFEQSEIIRINNGLAKSIFYNYSTMSVIPSKGVHYSNNQDIRSELAELLNVKGIFGEKERNSYWDNFLDAVAEHYLTWFEEGMKK